MRTFHSTSFVLPPCATASICSLIYHPTSAFTAAWNNPSSFRANFARSFRSYSSKTPRLSPNNNSNSNGSSFSGGKNFSNGSNGALFDGELFASSPELEQLALKSTDAPILTRVVSYNVLSSSLAEPTHFPHCDPNDLKATIRLQRLMNKLEGPIASRSIICLQEVSLEWSGHLHAFFANRGFHLMLASHGSYFNGYMGEGLAFPLDLFEAIDLRIERLTDMMKWPSKIRQIGLAKLVSNLQLRFQKVTQALFGPLYPKRNNKKREPWSHAQARHNRFIFARLKSRTNGAKICIGTYHMPCVYWSPSVMLIHSALVVRSFQQLCGDDQGVLAGDFNIKPTDSSYEMITTGKIDENHPDFPPASPDGKSPSEWFPKPLAPMKSAYHEILGSEPDFTNYARVENQPVFIETLDYLFCTQDMDLVDVIRLPDRSSVQGPLPISNEPSDHVMIGATLRLPAASSRQRKESKMKSYSK